MIFRFSYFRFPFSVFRRQIGLYPTRIRGSVQGNGASVWSRAGRGDSSGVEGPDGTRTNRAVSPTRGGGGGGGGREGRGDRGAAAEGAVTGVSSSGNILF